jgi:nitroreductase
MFTDDIETAHELTDLERIMMSRFANRFYLNREVDPAIVKGILNSARYAATGANVQPWRVHVTAGNAKERLINAISAVHEASPGDHSSEYRYLPEALPEPFASRLREFGTVFFGSLGIGREDVAARAANTSREGQLAGPRHVHPERHARGKGAGAGHVYPGVSFALSRRHSKRADSWPRRAGGLHDGNGLRRSGLGKATPADAEGIR